MLKQHFKLQMNLSNGSQGTNCDTGIEQIKVKTYLEISEFMEEKKDLG